MANSEDLLSGPTSSESYDVPERTPSAYNPKHSFRLAKGENKHYQQQFADTYFLRLAKLKPAVVAIAEDAWADFQIAGEHAQRVERVLDVRQGQLCWMVGTIYMDLPLKPNILEDISKDHWISGPPPRHSYFSSDPNATQTMLEDESGRLRLTGAMLKSALLVTGVIVAVLGTENANGDFEVLEIHVPDLPRQPQRWERDDADAAQAGSMDVDHKSEPGRKVALISGLGISGNAADNLNLALLSEYLLGESLGSVDQESASHVSRLIIAGNSLNDPFLALPASVPETGKKAASKKYGYDATSYNPTPTAHLDQFLAELLPSIPVTIMAGEYDPANTSLPQQSIHQAMFPHSRAYAASKIVHDESETPEAGWFDSVTNPWEGDIEGWRFLGNSGQPIDDIFKYVEFGGPDGQGADGRLEVMEHTLRWRCVAPTAPDTLWCYPFQDKDQFVIEECPHVYFVGNQPRFDSTAIEGPAGQQVRIIAVPKFSETGEVVMLDTETLEVEIVKISVFDGED